MEASFKLVIIAPTLIKRRIPRRWPGRPQHRPRLTAPTAGSSGTPRVRRRPARRHRSPRRPLPSREPAASAWDWTSIALSRSRCSHLRRWWRCFMTRSSEPGRVASGWRRSGCTVDPSESFLGSWTESLEFGRNASGYEPAGAGSAGSFATIELMPTPRPMVLVHGNLMAHLEPGESARKWGGAANDA